MKNDNRGHLLIIGGAEDKTGENIILGKAGDMLENNQLLTIITTATQFPEEVGNSYKRIFLKLGLKNIQILNINTRDIANENQTCQLINKSKCLFFTGGDQLRITSILGGTKVYQEIQDVYYRGGIIMGTSAGASAMSSTMIVKGEDNEPPKKCTLKMAPGLGLLHGVIIDQHFDQRGRFGRLLCGIAENPDILGIGIDEDTAIIVFPDLHFEVIGNNSVTIIDGRNIKCSNVSELEPNELLAIIGVTVHTIPKKYGFDLIKREVIRLDSGGNTDGNN